MKNYLPLITQNALFANVSPDSLPEMLNCIHAYRKSYSKGEFIFPPKQNITELALVLKGSIVLSNEDFFGNKNVLDKILPGELCGEAYAALNLAPQMSIQAGEECEVLLLPIKKLTTVCTNACSNHSLLIQNLLRILAQRNQQLVTKFSHISKRTTREKLLSYLYLQSRLQNSNTFTIPFNRQELADYLFVERSAMSHELSKLRDEGLLDYHRNSFKLFQAKPDDNLS